MNSWRQKGFMQQHLMMSSDAIISKTIPLQKCIPLNGYHGKIANEIIESTPSSSIGNVDNRSEFQQQNLHGKPIIISSDNPTIANVDTNNLIHYQHNLGKW